MLVLNQWVWILVLTQYFQSLQFSEKWSQCGNWQERGRTGFLEGMPWNSGLSTISSRLKLRYLSWHLIRPIQLYTKSELGLVLILTFGSESILACSLPCQKFCDYKFNTFHRLRTIQIMYLCECQSFVSYKEFVYFIQVWGHTVACDIVVFF